MNPAPKYGLQSMGPQDSQRARLTPPYEKYTYAMLRSECYARSLSISGKSSITTKSGFIQLLYEYDKASSQPQNQVFERNWKQNEAVASVPVRPPNLKFHQPTNSVHNQVALPGNMQRGNANAKQTRAKRGCRFRLINVMLTPTFVTRWRDLRYEHNDNWLWVNVQDSYLKHSELHDRLHFQDNLFVDIHPDVIVSHSAAKLRQMWSEMLTMFKRAILQSRKITSHGNAQTNVSFSQSFFEFCWGRLDLLYLHKGLTMKPELLDIVMEEKVRNESVYDTTDATKGLDAKAELSVGHPQTDYNNLQMPSSSATKQSVPHRNFNDFIPVHQKIRNNKPIVQISPFESQITQPVLQRETKAHSREYAGGKSNNMPRKGQQAGNFDSTRSTQVAPQTYQNNTRCFPGTKEAGHDFLNTVEYAKHQVHNKENLAPTPQSKRPISQIASQVQDTPRERKNARSNYAPRKVQNAGTLQEKQFDQIASQKPQANTRTPPVPQGSRRKSTSNSEYQVPNLNNSVTATPIKHPTIQKISVGQEKVASREHIIDRSDFMQRKDQETGKHARLGNQSSYEHTESEHDQEKNTGNVNSTVTDTLPRPLNGRSPSSIAEKSPTASAEVVTNSQISNLQVIEDHGEGSDALEFGQTRLEGNDDQTEVPTLPNSIMETNNDQSEKYAIIEQLSGSSTDTMSLSTLLVEGSENSDQDTQPTQMHETQVAPQVKEYTFIAPENTHKENPICQPKSKPETIGGTELDLVRPSKRMHATRAVCTTTTTHSSVMATTDRWDLLEERLRKINQSIDRCHEGLSSVSKLQECHRRDLEADLAFYSAIKRQLQQELVMSMHFDSDSYMTTSHRF
uniref:Uncharacterized protein AlNc14C32G2976 n=1 Tax=Albugo laibachii Nc14 TaxID=890382 RepID=F0W827_9STRA|nr:conserved hypothetical protein [Albugo laibachii Nc14]|eukprot:CCA17280.1 conserved hypothetical protein [Albugo laibachii Nc14]